MQQNIASDMSGPTHGHTHPEHAAPQAPHAHAHEHGHVHAHGPASAQTTASRRLPVERSLLGSSAWQRLAGAALLIGALWAVVAWALTGNPT